MDKKIFNIITIIFIVWLIILTAAYFFISKKINSITDKINILSVAEKNAITVSSSDISPFAEGPEGKIFGKYTEKDFDSFGGWFIFALKNKINDVLIVSGYLNLKQEVLNKEVTPPFLPRETKFIVINKDTKIIDNQGRTIKIDDLAPEDYLTIVPYEAAEYPSTSMLATQITVAKKVWPKGENPFE